MIYLNDKLDNFIEAKEYHYKFLSDVIRKKLTGKGSYADFDHIMVRRKNGIDSSIRTFLLNEENLRNVLIGEPKTLDQIKENFSDSENIRKLFNYDKWTSGIGYYQHYNAYHLAQKLNIGACTYCNRIYTKTVTIPDKITRPQYDHWFAKAKYPLLALSFYNIIPSCNICNCTVKGSDELALNTHLHPYIDRQVKYRFSFEHKDYNNFNFKIITEDGTRDHNFVRDFKLREIYETHEDEIKELRQLRDIYSDRYLDILSSQFTDLTVSFEELYRLAFGTFEDEAFFYKRPLSRMKRDILTELGIIKKNLDGI